MTQFEDFFKQYIMIVQFDLNEQTLRMFLLSVSRFQLTVVSTDLENKLQSYFLVFCLTFL